MFVNPFIPWSKRFFLKNFSEKPLGQGKTFTAREHDGFGKVVLTFELVDEILWCDHLNETSLVVLVVLFVWYLVLNFESVDRIPWCDHSNETSLVVFPHDTISQHFTKTTGHFWK